MKKKITTHLCESVKTPGIIWDTENRTFRSACFLNPVKSLSSTAIGGKEN